jgi:hypothetical protein
MAHKPEKVTLISLGNLINGNYLKSSLEPHHIPLLDMPVDKSTTMHVL